MLSEFYDEISTLDTRIHSREGYAGVEGDAEVLAGLVIEHANERGPDWAEMLRLLVTHRVGQLGIAVMMDSRRKVSRLVGTE